MTEMEAEPFTRTESFACAGPAELDIRIGAGRVEVRTADVPELRVEVSVEPGASPWWERTFEGVLGAASAGAYNSSEADAHFVRETQIAFSERRRRLVVRTPRTLHRIGLAIVVQAPSRSKLKASVHRGSVAASGVLSELVAATGSGPVAAEHVDGMVGVATGSGDVRLGRVAGRLRARMGSGEFDVVSVEGDGVKLTTGSGDVWLGVVCCDAQVRTGSGSLVVAEAASGDLSLVTGSGDVRVGVRPGVAAQLDVVSGSGWARSELDVSDQPPPGAPVVRIRARTGSGEAVVTSAKT